VPVVNNLFLSVNSVLKNCFKSNSISLLGAVLVCSALSGCGGGSGSKSAASVPLTSFSGTAAVGTAIANANVSGYCAAGTPSTTTDVNGKYTLQLAGLTLPCVLSVSVPASSTADPVYGTTTTLYSAVYAGQAVANITPITNLIITNALGADPSTITTSANVVTNALKLSSASIASAYAIINTGLTAGGITVPSNPLTSVFTAATASTAGDASDTSIDLFMNAIRQAQISNPATTLTTLTTGLKTATNSTVGAYITNTAQLTSSPNPGQMTLSVSVVVNGYNMATLPLNGGFPSKISTTQIDYAFIGGDRMAFLGTFDNTNHYSCSSNCPVNLDGLGVTGKITSIQHQDLNGTFIMGIQSLNINMASVASLLSQTSGFYKIWQLIVESNGGLQVTNNRGEIICPAPADPATAIGTITTNTTNVNIEQSFITNCKP
jgi:hypothetical protein